MKDKVIQKQQREQFTEDYEKYYPLVFSIIYSKINNANATDDICQEIFIKYYTKLDQIENPRKWLLGVMKNDLLNYYRRKDKNQIDVDSVFDDINMQFVNGMRDTRMIIEEAIDKVEMTERERLVFEYLCFYNFTKKNTAEILGITNSKVKYSYEKAVNRILAYLSEKGIRSIEDLL